MTLEQALPAKLLSLTPVTALVGQRVYPDGAIPQGTKQAPAVWPVLTYKQTGSNPTHYLTGERSAVERDSFELTAHGPDLLALAGVRDVLRAALSGTAARGTWGGVGGAAVRACLFEDVFSDDQPPADGSETRARTVRANLTVIWKR